jgi:transcriptional/translational regulatory protein YebC/TACO1
MDTKAANAPKEVILRNLEKGNKGQSKDDYKEFTYEYYGSGGIGILVNVITDNDRRAMNEICRALSKHSSGIRMAPKNAVSFKFKKKAKFLVNPVVNEDDLLNPCLENNINDYQLYTEFIAEDHPFSPSEEGHLMILTDVKDMGILRDKLREKGHETEVKFVNIPIRGYQQIAEIAKEINLKANEALEDVEDVDTVEHDIDLFSAY